MANDYKYHIDHHGSLVISASPTPNTHCISLLNSPTLSGTERPTLRRGEDQQKSLDYL
jgi:hypothetical protein